MKKEEIKKAVKEGYAKIAQGNSCCCGSPQLDLAKDISKQIGYSDEDLKSIPDGANLGLGCGNPVALASLKPGETVLDLGSGAGFDCFLAAKRVGPSGRVIGLDMTPEMIAKARANARKGNYTNVEFRLGEIEKLPVDDNSIDIVISNCVINLVPDKNQAFNEIFRALKPGGRMMISDIVLLKPLPDSICKSVSAYIGCLSGALLKTDYLDIIKTTGFKQVQVINEAFFPIDCMANDHTARAIIEKLTISEQDIKNAEWAVVSIKVAGVKPTP